MLESLEPIHVPSQALGAAGRGEGGNAESTINSLNLCVAFLTLPWFHFPPGWCISTSTPGSDPAVRSSADPWSWWDAWARFGFFKYILLIQFKAIRGGFYCISVFVSLLRWRRRVTLCVKPLLWSCERGCSKDASGSSALTPCWGHPRSLRFNMHCKMFVTIN